MLLNLKMNLIHKKRNKLINKNNNKTEFPHLESKNNNNIKIKNPLLNSIVNTLEK